MQRFTHKLAIDSLKTIAFKRYYAQVDNQRSTGLVETVQLGKCDSKMIQIIGKCLPVRGSRLTKFSNDPDLKKLWLYKSNAVPHQKWTTEDGKRKTCTLCCSTNKKGRKTKWMCKTCGVALCVTPFDNVVCYNKWHTKSNLNMCHNDAQKRLKANIDKNHDTPKAVAARTNGNKRQQNTSSCDNAQSSGLSSGLSVLATCASTKGQQTGVDASMNNALEFS